MEEFETFKESIYFMGAIFGLREKEKCYCCDRVGTSIVRLVGIRTRADERGWQPAIVPLCEACDETASHIQYLMAAPA